PTRRSSDLSACNPNAPEPCHRKLQSRHLLHRKDLRVGLPGCEHLHPFQILHKPERLIAESQGAETGLVSESATASHRRFPLQADLRLDADCCHRHSSKKSQCTVCQWRSWVD